MPAVFSNSGAQAASHPSTLGDVLGFLGPAVGIAGMAYGQAKDASAQNQKMKDWVANNSVPMTNAQMAKDTQAFNGAQVPDLGQAFQFGNSFAGQPGSQLISAPTQGMQGPFNANLNAAPVLGSGNMLQKYSPWPMYGNSFLGG